MNPLISRYGAIIEHHPSGATKATTQLNAHSDQPDSPYDVKSHGVLGRDGSTSTTPVPQCGQVYPPNLISTDSLHNAHCVSMYDRPFSVPHD